MKTLFIGMLIFVGTLKVKAQTDKDELKLMIDSAITMKYLKYSESSKKLSVTPSDILFLINEQDQPLNYLPSSKNFHFINIYDIRNRKIISQGIYAWKVITSLNKNIFVVNIIDFLITYKKHKYNFGNGGGSKTIFKYSCEDNNWKLVDFVNNGN